MLYFSHILNSKIQDSADVVVGRLLDVLVEIREGSYSPACYLLVRGRHHRDFFIPYEYVENLSRQEVSLKNLIDKIPTVRELKDDYIYLRRDVLDQQIVDVEGARVVRVNDITLGFFENRMCALGIDISTRGLLRRLGITGLDFLNLLKFFKVNLIDWRDTQPVKGELRLDKVADRLEKLHPADLANIIEDLSVKHGSNLVKSLDTDHAAKVLEEIEPDLQKMLVKHLGPEKAAGILQNMSTEEIVDLMQMLPKEEAREFLSFLQSGKNKNVEKLFSYKEDTAGGIMTTDFVSARLNWTVRETIAEIKRLSPDFRSIIYVYIVDEQGVFWGALSMRRLIIANPDQTMGEIARNIPLTAVLRLDDGVNKIIELMTKYDLFSAAVIDDNNQLVGAVMIDDVMRIIKPNA